MNNYKYYTLKLENINSFESEDTFTCGQCFRWIKEDDSSYTGVIKNGVLNVNKKEKDIYICGYLKDINNIDEFRDLIYKYLDLNRDYEIIQEVLSKDDEIMKIAIKSGKGIRILNQDSWEMLISYIISAANNIPRITKIVETLSKNYGEKIIIPNKILPNVKNREFYLFPNSNELSKVGIEDLRACNMGFRDKYVYNAVKLVNDKKVDLEEIKNLDYFSAKKELSKIQGVGSKIADCILLFSMEKHEAFPVDTWILKAMNELYIDSKNVKKINLYAIEKFGENAGIAQQYLFYHYRNKI